MIVLGINAFHADVSAVLLRDGKLLAAVEEERFKRIKHTAGFPRAAILKVIEMAAVSPGDIDHFAISRNPRAHLWRKVLFTLQNRPSLDLITRRLRNAGQVRQVDELIAESLGLPQSHVGARLHHVEHHPAHLASSFFVSGFDEAAVCAVDGFGDFVSTSLASGSGNRIEVLERVFFPHSVGQLYLAITQYLGFPNFGDEFKVMGLAPYGQPRFQDELRQLIQLKENGLFELDLNYFRHWSEGDQMSFTEDVPRVGRVFSSRLENLLGPARQADQPLESRHEDVAASLQLVFEETVFHLLNHLHRLTGQKRLCLAGGCAMNSVANGKIREHTPFQELFIQPASGDNGTALGAAFHVWNQVLDQPKVFQMKHSLWGPDFQAPSIQRRVTPALDEAGCAVTQLEETRLLRRTAEAIADGRVVGWFQGRMEWGARALGNRSILADPRRADMRSIINAKIKFREKFRPFAPAVKVESLDQYFEGAVADPFMLQVYPVRKEMRPVIPAVTHVDGSGRLQTVSQLDNPLFWGLLDHFEQLTGVPVLLNTSFNENEPIVHQPEEAVDCFLRTDMDVLVLGQLFVEKVASAVATDASVMGSSIG